MRCRFAQFEAAEKYVVDMMAKGTFAMIGIVVDRTELQIRDHFVQVCYALAVPGIEVAADDQRTVMMLEESMQILQLMGKTAHAQ